MRVLPPVPRNGTIRRSRSPLDGDAHPRLVHAASPSELSIFSRFLFLRSREDEGNAARRRAGAGGGGGRGRKNARETAPEDKRGRSIGRVTGATKEETPAAAGRECSRIESDPSGDGGWGVGGRWGEVAGRGGGAGWGARGGGGGRGGGRGKRIERSYENKAKPEGGVRYAHATIDTQDRRSNFRSCHSDASWCAPPRLLHAFTHTAAARRTHRPEALKTRAAHPMHDARHDPSISRTDAKRARGGCLPGY
jgi:hypothetical protein